MLNSLFTQPSILARHINAPYREERERYLRHCEQQGYALQTLLLIARELLWIAQKLPVCPDDGVTVEQIRTAAAANDWKDREHSCGRKLNLCWTRIRFIQIARTWLRFLGYWREPDHPVPFMPLLEAYKAWMQGERGFTTATIQISSGYLQQFLRWYGSQHDQFSPVCLNDIDTFLGQYGARGNCRKSVKNMAMALRSFFKYAGTQGWCPPEVAPNIHGPRIFTQENLPYGPSWPEVTRLITSMDTNLACDIRDKAITMLFAIYGFRCTEVVTLRLEDIDWEQNLISVSRAKRRGRQTLPLVALVGNAIIRYLQEVRPRSSCREIFLTLTPPYRPLSRGGIYHVVCHRMKALSIQVPHLGPHSLRHACATHLIVEGFSLKEIGDHLGHRGSSATRIYAKVDLPGLREVAKFDIGGLL
jgi:site-specific recombinase XerD